jgi:zinc transport system substrate-binding protein
MKRPGSAIAYTVALLLGAGSAHAEAPRVLASIAPIHSLVSAVMEGAAVPELLVPATASDHDYALKPSDLRKVAAADLVVWVGEPLEAYLVKAIEAEGVGDLELLDVPGADPRPFGAAPTEPHEADESRHGASEHDASEAHAAGGNTSEEEERHGHDHAGLDPHIWLDPVRAQAIVTAVAERLASLDPAAAGLYRRNAATSIAALKALDGEIRLRLNPLAGKPFVTFHDGYSYFVERYGLRQVGHLTVDPDRRPGAATLRALQAQLADEGAVCAFVEPQFDAAAIEGLSGQSGIAVGVLDALGADLEPGPALYPTLLRKNAAAVESCLSGTS